MTESTQPTTQTSPPFTTPIFIRYTGTASYEGAAARWLHANEPVYQVLAARERRWSWRLAIALYLIIAIFAVHRFTRPANWSGYSAFYLVLCVVLPVLPAMYLGTRRSEWRKFERELSMGSAWANAYSHWRSVDRTWRATSEGIRAEFHDSIYIDRWNAFEDVGLADDAVILLGVDRFLPLPRHGFQSEAQVQSFVAQVQQLLLETQNDRGSRLQRLLAQPVPNAPVGSHWKCWSCGYELTPQGVADGLQPKCSECGVSLREGSLRTAAGMDVAPWRTMLWPLMPMRRRRPAGSVQAQERHP